MSFEDQPTETDTSGASQEGESPDKDALPAQPTQDDSALGDTDEHSDAEA